ncbi:MAG: hypothetical protein AAF488_06010 [Planctomycetota bacterium]
MPHSRNGLRAGDARRLVRRGPIAWVLAFLLALAVGDLHGQSTDATNSETAGQLRTESRAPYFHRLTLYDHDGEAISPEDPEPRPYSPRATCGKCHAYETIACGWHFNAGKEGVDSGRASAPWTVVDPALGTVLPISLRDWPGTFEPEAVGLTRFDFAKRFGRHLPGGGWIEPKQRVIDETPEAVRWNISGAVEIDCMVCHDASRRHDPTQAERQLEHQNFRWIPTVALGLGRVRGKAKAVPDNYDPFDPNSAPGQSPPTVEYRSDKFDADERVHFDITRRPDAQQCYFCHSEHTVGQPRWQHEGDVHLAAGLTCVDCHTNGIDHRITRGYEDEGEHRPEVATRSCRGCHLDDNGGHFGAPRPIHAGIPPLHLTEMSCTSCHAGLAPKEQPSIVQTSLHHALGIPTKEPRTEPTILAPIFARDDRGVITPYRSMPVSYFAVRGDDGAWNPVPVNEWDTLRRALDDALPVLPDSPEPTRNYQSSEFLDAILRAITTDERQYGYVARGEIRTAAGAEPFEAPTEIRWPIGHDVRPARQALGAGGCVDCHSADAAIFHGQTRLAADAPEMFTEFGSDPNLVRAWEGAVAGRTSFKWVAWLGVAVIVLITIAGITEALRRRLFAANAPANDTTGEQP